MYIGYDVCNNGSDKHIVPITRSGGPTNINGSVCDCFILTVEQIVVLNKYCTYNKPIPKIPHVETPQDLCRMKYK